MSTGYYLACHHHHHVCAAACSTFGKAGGYGHERHLGAFIISHKDCVLSVVDEDSPEVDGAMAGPNDGVSIYDWLDWKAETIDYDLAPPASRPPPGMTFSASFPSVLCQQCSAIKFPSRPCEACGFHEVAPG